MANAFPYRICFVEDSSVVAEPIELGMKVLLNAEVDRFTTTNEALREMKKLGFDRWGVFVFDNRTGFENMSGIELAGRVKKEHPNALIVSLNSSNLDELRAYGADKLRREGVEFWYKNTESFLMIAWLADCAKEKRMLARDKWLESIGETTRYLIEDIDPDRRTERELRGICVRLCYGVDPELKGVLMTRDVKDYLQELIGAKRGVERV